MKSIILAAGVGSRLHPLTQNIPKTLIKVNGKPMLQYLIDNLLANNIKNITICTGFQSEKIKEFCSNKYPKIKFNFIENKNFAKTNNMYSLYLAKKELNDDLILMNADLVYEKSIIAKLKKTSGTCVAVEKGAYNEESMKITLKKNYVSSISKKIIKDEAYGCSIDVYKISKNDLQKMKKEMKKIIEVEEDVNQWTELMLNNLFKSGKIKAKPLDISGNKWYEIDDFADLEKAELLFNQKKILELKNKKIYFIDGDGTLYLGDKPILENLKYIKELQKINKNIFFMTNNTSKLPSDYLRSLKKKGINFELKQILTPLLPIIIFLKNKNIKNIHLVANKKISKFFKRNGFKLNSKNPQAIILTYDTEINFSKLKETSNLLRKNIPYYATHPDLVCSTKEGPIPDIGCFIKTFEFSTGRIPEKIFGKPNKDFFKPILKRYNLKEKDMVIIGDRLSTDIKMAENSDITSILTLTGETTRELLQETVISPDIIVKSLKNLKQD